MILLLLGLAVFIAIHWVPTRVAVRQGLVRRLGIGAYKGLFSALSLAGLIILIIGKTHADFVPVWNPPVWSRHAALALMPFSLILIAAAYMRSNFKRMTAHPMLWGVTVWAAAHLFANGDLASILLFGGFGAYALYAMRSANMRGAAPSDKHYPLANDLAVVAVGLLAYGVLLLLHPYLFGVSPLS